MGFVALDDVTFIEVPKCDIQPKEADPSLTTTTKTTPKTTTPVPSTEPPDGMYLVLGMHSLSSPTVIIHIFIFLYLQQSFTVHLIRTTVIGTEILETSMQPNMDLIDILPVI